MNSDLISIIIPVYNVQDYLKECVDAIINQSYSNIEVILVNDGSTDNSPAICDEYSKKDSRIKVIHKKNEGPAMARNAALDIASGKYLNFIDSDDLIHKDMISILYNNLINNDADISICNYQSFFDTVKEESINKDDVICYTNEQAIYELNMNNKFTLALWSKLYKSTLFENLRLPHIKASCDNYAVYKTILDSNKIVYTPNSLYYYRERPESITHKKTFINIDLLYQGRRVIELVKNTMPSQCASTMYKYMFGCLGLYNKMLNNNCVDEKNVAQISMV